MSKRFVSVWFRHLMTDWMVIRQPSLKEMPFVLAMPDHGRMVITAVNALAQIKGIDTGMVVADARAICPNLQVIDDKPDLPNRLLTRIAEWCIRFTPVAAVDLPDGLILDTSGCSHLWGGDEAYLTDMAKRLNDKGYAVRIAIADTVGAAWGMARYGKGSLVVEKGRHYDALLSLPPEALRLDADIVERLHKLGLRQIKDFNRIQSPALRRRFGASFIKRLNQAFGVEEEFIQAVQPAELYHERLPCLEPIVTHAGIETALHRLLEQLCNRLQREQKGLRKAIFKSYRVDGNIQQVTIGTNHPSYSIKHLMKLFEEKITTIEPDLGIELFVLEAPQVEDAFAAQKKLWTGGLDKTKLYELLDRIAGKVGADNIYQYMPVEHHWPERSYRQAPVGEETNTVWKVEKPRPWTLLPTPERIEVSAPVPDYPPMLFRYKGKLHTIVKADGPERIEQEWWVEEGMHRDYYYVEDEEGKRYWLFRLGHYTGDKRQQWFLHGFFV